MQNTGKLHGGMEIMVGTVCYWIVLLCVFLLLIYFFGVFFFTSLWVLWTWSHRCSSTGICWGSMPNKQREAKAGKRGSGCWWLSHRLSARVQWAEWGEESLSVQVEKCSEWRLSAVWLVTGSSGTLLGSALVSGVHSDILLLWNNNN